MFCLSPASGGRKKPSTCFSHLARASAALAPGQGWGAGLKKPSVPSRADGLAGGTSHRPGKLPHSVMGAVMCGSGGVVCGGRWGTGVAKDVPGSFTGKGAHGASGRISRSCRNFPRRQRWDSGSGVQTGMPTEKGPQGKIQKHGQA